MMRKYDLFKSVCITAILSAGVALSLNTNAKPPSFITPPADAVQLTDGLSYQVLEPGHGSTHPNIDSVITVNFALWTANGKEVYNTKTSGNGKPATMHLNKLIIGWQRVLPLMVTGERIRVWIPGALAYDNRPDRPKAPKGNLVFDIDLVSFK